MTWDITEPDGSEIANTIDDIFRELKSDLQVSFRAQETEGTEAVFPGTDTSNPIYRPRFKTGNTAALPSADADQGIYVNTQTNEVLRCDDSNWVAIASLIPAGTINPFGGTSAPGGWLLCEGAAVSRTTYATLYAAIGDAFGEGDGATTFDLPDLKGRFLRGHDNSAGRDPDAAGRTAMNTGGNTGDNVGSVQVGETGDSVAGISVDNESAHTHTEVGNAASSFLTDGSGASSVVAATGTKNGTTGSGSAHSHGLSTFGNETRPINASVKYIIKI